MEHPNQLLGKRVEEPAPVKTPTIKVRTAVKTKVGANETMAKAISQLSGPSALKEILSPAREDASSQKLDVQTESWPTRTTEAGGDLSSPETVDVLKHKASQEVIDNEAAFSKIETDHALVGFSLPGVIIPPPVIAPKVYIPQPIQIKEDNIMTNYYNQSRPVQNLPAPTPVNVGQQPSVWALNDQSEPPSLQKGLFSIENFFKSTGKIYGKVKPGLKVITKQSISTTVHELPPPPPVTDFSMISPIEIDSSSEQEDEEEDASVAHKSLGTGLKQPVRSFLQPSSLALLDDSVSPEPQLQQKKPIPPTIVFDIRQAAPFDSRAAALNWTAKDVVNTIDRILTRKYGPDYQQVIKNLEGQQAELKAQVGAKAADDDDEDIEIVDSNVRQIEHPFIFDGTLKFDFETSRVIVSRKDTTNKLRTFCLQEPFQAEYYPGCISYHRQYVLGIFSLFYISELGAVVAYNFLKMESFCLAAIEDAVCLCKVEGKFSMLYVLTKRGHIYTIKEKKGKETYEIKEFLDAKPLSPFSAKYTYTTLREFNKYLFVTAYSPVMKMNWVGVFNTNLNLSSYKYLEEQKCPIHMVEFASKFKDCFRMFLLNTYDTISYLDVARGKISGGVPSSCMNINLEQLKRSHMIANNLVNERDLRPRDPVHMYYIKLRDPVHSAAVPDNPDDGTGKKPAALVPKASLDILGDQFKTTLTATFDENTIKRLKHSVQQDSLPSAPDKGERQKVGSMAPFRPAFSSKKKTTLGALSWPANPLAS